MGGATSHASFAEWAAKEGRSEDLEYHIRHGGPNVCKPRDVVSKITLLHLAAAGGHKECVSVLLTFGMSVNLRDADRKTPLHLAAYNRMCECVKLLVNSGAEVDALTRFQSTPLHYASFVGSTSCAQVLLEHGADIDAKESWGQSPLMIAVKQGNLEFVKYLLTQGPDLESVDHLDQQTPLHVACCGRDVDIVRCLLNAGCVINPLDKNNYTPLHLAIRRNFKGAVFLLLNRGAYYDNIQNLKNQMPHRLPLIALVEQTQGGPLSLRQQCMIKIRGVFQLGVIDKMPLPEEMKKEIKTIPQVYCEYQHVERDSKYDNLQSLDSEIDPLAQSKALISEGNSFSVHLTCLANVDRSSSTCPQKNSSKATANMEDSRTEITAEIVSQSPTHSAVHSFPVRNKSIKENEIQVY